MNKLAVKAVKAVKAVYHGQSAVQFRLSKEVRCEFYGVLRRSVRFNTVSVT